MISNPYEPSNVHAEHFSQVNDNRLNAQRSIRLALLIMLIPAIYNFVCFNFLFDSNRIEVPIQNIYRALDAIGMVAIVASIWFFGMVALEVITICIHLIVARKSKLADWKESLYHVLSRASFFAVPGAILWAVWVAAFYQLQLGFYTVSVPIGFAAHVLAACFYVPLFYRWYKIERWPDL